jgi:glucose-6-phosphate isomerase
MTNAASARAWLQDAMGEAAIGQHLAAVSTALAETSAFGVPPDRVFGFWDWVGGRYSLWSAVGLSCAIGLGWEAFEKLLAGAAEMDTHFQSAPLARNAPVMLALSHVLNRNGFGRPVRAVVPYAHRLRLFTAHLQQLEMESNGKGVDIDGRPVTRPTAATVFGDVGANSQHAFFQALHQGSDVIPVDFIAVQAGEGPPGHQSKLLANCLAQAEALMVGRRDDGLPPERRFTGDRPSNLILLARLDAHRLGALLALYEHKTFVEGVLWRINSFDQWGVELGKSLAAKILPELEGGRPAPHDPSTADLIARLKA